ncbi:MAG TPA: efflux RND transporter periplasmic adaptor subunit [Xanthobacteraceae bacterium]|jgi:multidrug efflux system membrane fusion protein|nr:efflux RND transporter periplasmic adaptor subunit [Xanthobacteraceae bacterium]
MDERTRRTDSDLAPKVHPMAPPQDVPPQGLPKRSRARFRIGLGIVAILLALGVYQTVHWIKATPPAGRFPQGAVQTVGAATVELGDVREIVNALGTVTPIATVTVQTQISGYLTQVGFNEGQMVKKGDFLAQIDQRPYQILKEQYQGQLAKDQGFLAQAQLDLTRYQTLAAQNSIAKQQADDQVFIVQQYQGTVKQDQGLIDAQDLNIAYCHIVSPVDGRVGLRLVDAGNYVQTASSTGIAVITQLQPITVVFSIPEDELPGIIPQLAAGTSLAVTAYDRANLRELATGLVSAVDNQIDTTTGTVKVKAQFDNPDNKLFPNQFVNARLLVTTLKNVVTVPTPAIQRGSPGAYVYVINADSTVAVRQIVTGVVDADMTQVRSGLSAGDRVVIDGTDRLRDGLKVIVTNETGAVSPAPAGRAGGHSEGQGGRQKSQGLAPNPGQHTGQPSAAPSGSQ